MSAGKINQMERGAEFSECRKFRYALWRIWDRSAPFIMFVGLNPSTANENTDDATIRSIIRIAKANGYGGVYMMNCFPFITTDPDKLDTTGDIEYNDFRLRKVARLCNSIVFAWGSFKVVKETGRDKELTEMFPNAYAISINKDGSPKHSLYCKTDTNFVKWSQ